MRRQDPRVAKATARAAQLVEAVADGDIKTIRELTSKGDQVALTVALATFIDPESPLVQRHVVENLSLPQTRALLAIDRAAEHFKITRDDVLGTSKVRHIVDARAVACYAAHRLLGITCVEVGRVLNKDHTTVLYACGRVGEDARLRRIATELAESIGWHRDDPEAVA